MRYAAVGNYADIFMKFVSCKICREDIFADWTRSIARPQKSPETFDEQPDAAFKSPVPRQPTKENTMKFPPIQVIILALISLSLSACSKTQGEEHHPEAHRIVATSPQSQAVTLTQQYVCRGISRRSRSKRARR